MGIIGNALGLASVAIKAGVDAVGFSTAGARGGALSERGPNLARRMVSYSWDWGSHKGYQQNSLVYACVEAIATAIPNAILEVRKPDPNGRGEVIEDHPLSLLLARPNPWMDDYELWHLTSIYYLLGGNAYWWKGRNGGRAVVELMPIRPDLVEPRQTGNAAWAAANGVTSGEWIDYYEYNLSGQKVIIPVGDIVHFRHGHDPNNPRKGLPPLAPILAEVGLDAMATEHVTALLDNYAIPGLAVKVKRRISSPTEANEIKARFMASYGGPKRGEPMVMDQDTELQGLNVTPQQMELPDLRDVSETRICAAFKVPPIVVGANVGLKRGTYSNYEQARSAFWDEGIGPRLRAYRSKINAQLLPDFDTSGSAAHWNLSEVRALQEGEGAKYNRTLDAAKAGLITRNEWRAQNGHDDIEDGEVYLIPGTVKEREVGLDALAAANAPKPIQLPPGTAPAQTVREIAPPAPGDTLPTPTGDVQSGKQLTAGLAKIYALPMIATKSADNAERIARVSVRLRDQLAEGFSTEIADHFERVGKRAERRAKAHTEGKAAEPIEEAPARFAYPFTVDDLLQAKDWIELAGIFGKQYATVLELLWSEIDAVAPNGARYDAGDPFVQDFTERGSQRVTGISDKTRTALREHLATSLEKGYSVDQLVGGIIDADTKQQILAPLRDIVSGEALRPGIYREEYERAYNAALRKGSPPEEAGTIAREKASRKASDSRAFTIARTELGYAANAGAAARYKSTGLVLAVRVYDGDDCGWKGHNDPDKAHLSYRSLEEAEAHTLAHPNAVFAPSRYRSYGDTIEMISAWYDGPAVELAFTGDKGTTIGPNHPVLTVRGFVKACELREGDQVVYDARSEFTGMAGSETNFVEMPPAQDAFDTLRPVSTNARIPASGDDFHGDGMFCQGEVEVIRPQRQLLHVADPCGGEQCGEGGFVRASAQDHALPGNGASIANGERILLAATGGMGGGATGHYRLLDILSVRETRYTGWAYDATTEYSLYCSDGIVVSNCQRAFGPVTDPAELPEGWNDRSAG